ncbi:MAG: hypothetical protein Ct9H300mP16_11870 [Pseudomonadota bacterium]|nr:MAG: hypothetical protein Ct9H300mP16_11870 [Pseudomonadota bacterium]
MSFKMSRVFRKVSCPLDNVLMSPHIGTATAETRDAMGIRVIDNIETFLRTGRPGDSVEP